MVRKIVHDSTSLADAKIVQDDQEVLVMRAVIASEMTQKYEDGVAYKAADELEKAAWTANGRWVKVLSHPASKVITQRSDINGIMENAHFRKDLNDPKTNRPCRRGIEVDVKWFKDRTPKEVLDQARSLTLKDNSIGFSCEQDWTPGEFQGSKYDYVQRDICIDHLAAPIKSGRCPNPLCGLSVDSEEKPFIEVQNADLGISYRFDPAKFTPEKAQEWVAKRTHKDCPVCSRMEEVGLLTSAQRLFKQYGADVLEVIEGHELPPKPQTCPVDAVTESDKAIAENKRLLTLLIGFSQ